MVYSYSGSQERRYRYYVCLNAQRQGWGLCPAKSLSARMIEESIVERIRQAKRGIEDPGAWQKMDRTQQVETVLGIVERIGYDGTTRQISIRFHPSPRFTGTDEGMRHENQSGANFPSWTPRVRIPSPAPENQQLTAHVKRSAPKRSIKKIREV
jgi:hypothetical protein